MPSPGTLFALSAVGIAGFTYYAHRSQDEHPSDRGSDRSSDSTTKDRLSPHAMGRRGSKGTSNDLWDSGMQAEHNWRRDYGINFGHNSHAKFPFDQSERSLLPPYHSLLKSF
ncbi:hypothetical protein BDF14DRAFT_1881125 [Spinellus fusiger]|nr:hypothetical protein BDF14DRAFT_1881125 [Spinellus fusiger]